MLNNEFKLIGTILSDFEDTSNDANFKKWKFTIEVEKKDGKYNTLDVVVYGTNRNIDVSQSLVNHLVVVNGYIDCYKKYLTLIAQDILDVAITDKHAIDIDVSGVVDDNDDMPF